MSEYVLRIGDTEYRAEVKEITSQTARIVVNQTEYAVDLVQFGRAEEAAVREVPRPAPRAATPSAPAAAAASARSMPQQSGAVTAPLPGLVLELKVKEGDAVKAGQPVVVMEAMKMENVVPAPHNGTVRRLFVAAGDSVGEGDPLVEIARPEMTTL